MKTYLPKDDPTARKWQVIDADGKVLGRLAVQIANILRGKDKPIFTAHLDAGDFVVVVNAEKVHLTGRKETDKTYERYSGWRGGRRVKTAAQVRASHPERLIMHAVKGMLPKNKLAARLLTKLKVYPGPEHPHIAQKPSPVTLSA
jgi:large subunit ribosomal protein L13